MANQRDKSRYYKRIHEIIVDEIFYNGKENLVKRLFDFNISEKRIRRINAVFNKYDNLNELGFAILQIIGLNMSYDCWTKLYKLPFKYKMGFRKEGKDFFEIIDKKPFQPTIIKNH